MRCLPYLLPLATLPLLGASVILNCDNIYNGGVSWDIKPLDGEYTVHHIREDGTNWLENTTYTISVCKKLTKPPKPESEFFCKDGTRVCAQQWKIPTDELEGKKQPPYSWAVAGDFSLTKGDHFALDPKITRLKGSASHGDSAQEGFRLELNGGSHNSTERRARTIIEFICNHDKTGLEGQEDKSKLRSMADSSEGDKQPEDKYPDLDKGKSLQFKTYDMSENPETLRLVWETKYACEDQKGKGNSDSPSKGGWGFFTWFIIILFLAIASYLIFGSWLNYNRYGARGWDLLPHGDTIRDLPYLLKDWARRVVSTVQGSGSRGGYSAI